MGLYIAEIEAISKYIWKDIGLYHILDSNYIFPSPWKELINSHKSKSCVLFSYWELGSDIYFKNERFLLIKKIISALSYQNDILLWPICALYKKKITPFEEFFYKGIFLKKPKLIVLFGEKIFNFLFPKRSLQFEKFSIGKYKILPLPSIDMMLPDNKKVKKFVWEKLKKI